MSLVSITLFNNRTHARQPLFVVGLALFVNFASTQDGISLLGSEYTPAMDGPVTE